MTHGSAVDRWAEIKELFWAVSDATPDERERVLAGADESVRVEVRRLLDASLDVGDRFDRPAIASLGTPTSDVDAGTSPSLVGRRVGAYEVVRRIGEGGMGTVYEGARVDDAFRQRVAIKTVWRGVDSTLMARRLRSERQILAALDHPNIARLLDGGTTSDGLPYLVMELVDGEPIDAWCDARRLVIAARLALFTQVCTAVSYAHRQLTVHRDLKPSNVFVTAGGVAKLLDFGVAKLLDDAGRADARAGTLTSAGLSPFTPGFAAPEQAGGGAVSTATDVYALGALLYVLLTGRVPYDADRLATADAIVAMRESPLAPPSVVVAAADDDVVTARGVPNARRLARALAGELDAIVLTALRREPERRYATVDALAADVARFLTHERVHARPDTMGYRVRTFVRRERRLVAASSLALLAVVGGAAAALWQARASRAEAARSERVARFFQTMMGGGIAPNSVLPLGVGPHTTLAEWLDSASRRVPSAFRDDPGVRARLYTAVASSYLTQARVPEATRLADSALDLASASYGRRSDAFAEASLVVALAALKRADYRAAATHVAAARAAIAGREAAIPHMHAAVLGSEAYVALSRGDTRATDSLARAVLAVERRRVHGPTPWTAMAEILLGSVVGQRGDVAGADSLFARGIATTDALGDHTSGARLDALTDRINLLTAIGHRALAESLSDEGLRAAAAAFGVGSGQYAVFLAQRGALARLDGDTARARTAYDSAERVMAVTSSTPLEETFFDDYRITELFARHDYAGAGAASDSMLKIGRNLGIGFVEVRASLYAAQSHGALGHWALADSLLERGLARASQLGEATRLWVPLLGGERAYVAARRGDSTRAERMLATLPPAVVASVRARLARAH